MNYSRIIKIITLLGFVFLIAMFLLYRTGKLEFPRTSTENVTASDSGRVSIDSGHKTILSSSKTILLSDREAVLDDSANRSFEEDSLIRMKRTLLGSSKSGIIFTPLDTIAGKSKKRIHK